MNNSYTLKSKVWVYPGAANWHFVTLPVATARQINKTFWAYKRGWGSLPIEVTIGKTMWRTSIFPDKKSNSYVLPLKAEVRKKEIIKKGDTIALSLIITA